MRYTIATLLLLYLCIRISLQSTVVQTFLTQKIAGFLSGKLNTKVTVEGVEFELIKTFVLRGVYVEDQRQDTLLYAGFLKANVENLNFSENIFSLDEIILQEGKFRLKYYEGDSLLNLQFIIDALSSSDTSSSSESISITCHAVTVENSQFSLDDFNVSTENFGFDYNHIGISGINAKISGISIIGDTISGKMEQISANERSGLSLKNMTASASVSATFISLDDLKLSTANSEFTGNLYFNYSEYPDFYDFLNKVKITSHINKSEINFSDISYFATPLKGINKKIILSGDVKGTVNNLRGKNLHAQFGHNSFFSGDVALDGLPDIDETFITLNIKKIETNKRDIETLPIPPFDSANYISLPKNIATLGKMSFNGNFTGFINDFVALGKFNSTLGNFSSDIKLAKDSLTEKIFYEGNIATTGFNIGQLLEMDTLLGNVSGNFQVKGNGMKKDNVHLNLSGSITAFDFLKYRYNDIKVEGELTKSKFNGMLAINDKNIKMEFDGNVDFEPDLPVFQFESKIGDANLFALNLLKRDSITVLSTNAQINFFGNSIDNIQGEILLENTKYTEGKNFFALDSVKLLAFKAENEKILKLKSDFASGQLKGEFLIAELAPSFNYIISQILPSYYDKKPEKPKTQQKFTYNFDFFNTGKITNIFVPDLVLKTIHITGKYNSIEKEIALEIDAPDIKYKKSSLQNFTLNLSSSDDILTVTSNSSRFNISDSIWIENVDLVFKLTNDNVQFGYSWKNIPDSMGFNYNGTINGLASIYRKNKLSVHFLSSEITVADSTWKFADNNEINIDSTSIDFKNFIIKNENQQLSINGKISEIDADALNILLSNFNLKNLNIFSSASGITLSGIINGSATVSHVFSDILFTSDMKFNELTFNNELLGNGEFISIYNSKEEAIGINGYFGRDNNKTVNLRGFYYPNKKQDALDLTASINKLNLSLFSPYTVNIVSKLKGTASGNIIIKGNADAPELSGKINVRDAEFLFDYLNAYYTLNDAQIVIEKNWIGFNNAVATDAKGNKAIATGTILHENYKNFNLDISIDAKNFQAMNTNSTLNSLYYGKAYMTGLINISGNPDNLVLDINAKSEKGTEFFIPLSGPAEVSEQDFIKFVIKDSSKIKAQKEYQVNLSGIQLNFKLEVTPDAKIELIFDETAGDIMKARGRGNLMLEINTLGNFNMYGEYVVSEGDYLFTLKNIINKKFIVKSGGTITWNGSPYDAQLDLDAVYKLRTTLTEITGDTSNKRYPVECHMLMTNKIMNPDIKFDIQLPSVGQDERDALKTKVSTEQDMNKQVFSLLILNRFYPEQSGTTTGGEVAGTQTSELLSNQLSNWLSQSTNLVQLGVNYRAGSETTSQEVAVALSKQLFNDRISIEGNVGVGGTNQATGQNTNILDATLEYKISDDGRLKAKIFNESNDRKLADAAQSPYTQGVGVFYREEFDTFGEFFKNMFRRKKKDEKEGAEETGNDNGKEN